MQYPTMQNAYPHSFSLKVNPQQSVVQIVQQFPVLKSSFEAIGMSPDVNKAVQFESLVASCKVQQLPLEDVLDTLHQILKTTFAS